MSAVASLDEFLEKVAQRDGHQPEFLQAVREVFTSIWPFLEANPKYRSEALLERLVEPERAFQFRVAWTDDKRSSSSKPSFSHTIQQRNWSIQRRNAFPSIC